MYGVNHGGMDLDMRVISAKFIASQPFFVLSVLETCFEMIFDVLISALLSLM